MSKDYASLFQPLKINGLELKNRLVVPPMGSGFAAEVKKLVAQGAKFSYMTRAGLPASTAVELAAQSSSCSRSRNSSRLQKLCGRRINRINMLSYNSLLIVPSAGAILNRTGYCSVWRPLDEPISPRCTGRLIF